MHPALVLLGVTRRYAHPVLRGVDLQLEPGAVRWVIGGNGSGKSTLLRIAAGVSRPTGGRVERAAGPVAYAPEELARPPRVTGRGLVRQLARLQGTVADEVPALAVLDAIGFVGGLDAPVAQLSKGNAHKLLLAAALATALPLVVLDEPWTGLDAVSRTAVAQLVAARAAGGAAVLGSGHRPADVPQAATAVRLAEGVLVSDVPSSPPVVAWARVRLRLVGPPGPALLDAAAAHLGATHAGGSHEDPPWPAPEDGVVELGVAPDEVGGVLRAALAEGHEVWDVQRDGPQP